MNFQIYKLFICSHLLAYATLLLIPAESQHPNIEFIVLINGLFIILMLVFSLTTYAFTNNISKGGTINPDLSMNPKQLSFNILFVSFGALAGFFLILYDRIILRGIDYSSGLRVARYLWLNSEGGSFFGIIGNLLVPLGYLCFFMLIGYKPFLRNRTRLLLLISAIISIGGHALLNGGRSNLFIACIFVIITYALHHKNIVSSLFSLKPLNLVLLMLIMAYTSIISLSSASMADLSAKELALLGINDLYGNVTDSFDWFEIFGDFIYVLIYMAAYLYHGQWTAQIAYELQSREGSYTFNVFQTILHRLGLNNDPVALGYFDETGAFISLPGAFYYDYGYWGVVVLSILLGTLWGLAMLNTSKKKNISGTKLAFIYYILFIVLLSPMLPAYGFIYINFHYCPVKNRIKSTVCRRQGQNF